MTNFEASKSKGDLFMRVGGKGRFTFSPLTSMTSEALPCLILVRNSGAQVGVTESSIAQSKTGRIMNNERETLQRPESGMKR
jgi:hypothetical protein